MDGKFWQSSMDGKTWQSFMDGLPFLCKLCWTALVFSHPGNNLYFGEWELFCSKSRTRACKTWFKPLGVWREWVRRLELLLAKVRPEALLSLHLWNPRPPLSPTSSNVKSSWCQNARICTKIILYMFERVQGREHISHKLLFFLD